MNITKKKRQAGRRSSVGTGTTSLLMIFTLLCFATLAMLSVSTADSYRQLQTRGRENTQQLALAKGEAAEKMAELDAGLAQMQAGYTAGAAAYADEAAAYAETLGWTRDVEEGTLQYIIPMQSGSELVTEVWLHPLGGKLRYNLQRQVQRLSGGWQPEEDGQVYTG